MGVVLAERAVAIDEAALPVATHLGNVAKITQDLRLAPPGPHAER